MSDALERARAAVKRLKVFPLPSVVLLPGSALPLHIFEQRYRDLVRDALASDGVFAMAWPLPGQEKQLAGKPMLEPLLCVGVIGMHEPLDDGRYNLVVIGVSRARIVRELESTALYREVEAELLPDEALAGEEDEPLRQAIVELVARLPLEVGQRIAQVTARARGGALADLVAATVLQDTARRFEVLSELDVRERLRSVTEDTLDVVGRLKPRKREGLMN